MSESEYESSSSSSEEDLGSDYDPADFESSSKEDDSDDEDFEVLKSGKRKAAAKKSTAPAKKKAKTAAASKKNPSTNNSNHPKILRVLPQMRPGGMCGAIEYNETINPAQPREMGQGTMTVSNMPWAQGPANLARG